MKTRRIKSFWLQCPAILAFLLMAETGGLAQADDPAPPRENEQAARPSDGGPKVLNAQEAADLLRPPVGNDSYGPGAIDWRTVPPWRQSSFYGLRAEGRVLIFVVDCSGSMEADLRLIRAKQELRRSINALQFPQRYFIIFFNDQPLPMPGGLPKSTEHRDKLQTFAWLRSVPALGETDPRGAMIQALSLRPDAVFFLSDGEFDPAAEAAILARNTGKVPIHCIDLSGGAAGEQLRRIAEHTGGQYAVR